MTWFIVALRKQPQPSQHQFPHEYWPRKFADKRDALRAIAEIERVLPIPIRGYGND
jgi:hypothetical protein